MAGGAVAIVSEAAGAAAPPPPHGPLPAVGAVAAAPNRLRGAARLWKVAEGAWAMEGEGEWMTTQTRAQGSEGMGEGGAQPHCQTQQRVHLEVTWVWAEGREVGACRPRLPVATWKEGKWRAAEGELCPRHQGAAGTWAPRLREV